MTVLELLIVLVVFGIACDGIYTLLRIGVSSATFTKGSLQSQVQVRAALDTMVDEARWATSATAATANTVTLNVPTGTPFYGGGAYTVTFTYNAAAGTVTRQRLSPNPPDPAPVALAYNVTGFSLSYYDAASGALGPTPSDLTKVAMVQFNVTTATSTAGTGRQLVNNAALRAYVLP